MAESLPKEGRGVGPSSELAGKVRHQEFIGEPLTPVPLTGDAVAMARGEPGLPGRFRWRDQTYRVAGVIGVWKTCGPCRNGGGEMYLRRHWYKILAEPVVQPPEEAQEPEKLPKGARRALPQRLQERQAAAILMTVYCDRQARNRKHPKDRWWVYTTEPVENDATGAGRLGAS
ncbi:MAG: DUF6504 family protein [Phycisphaerae bacterium]|jgi:hypothetical protein